MNKLFRLKTTTAIILMLMPVLCPILSWAGGTSIQLPPPKMDGQMGVEKAISTWKTARQYAETPLTVDEVGQLLWAANGKTLTDAVSGATGRVIPSAWKVYPLGIFLLAGENRVNELSAGVYRYDPESHSLEKLATGDKRPGLSQAAFGQKWLSEVPVAVIIGVDFDKTIGKTTPEQRAEWGRLEAGTAGQNVLLQARALGLRTNTPALFKASELSAMLGACRLTPRIGEMMAHQRISGRPASVGRLL